MAIKDWHPGQLIIFLLGMGFVWSLLFVIANERVGTQLAGFITGALLLLVFPGVVGVVAWKWFGGRRKP